MSNDSPARVWVVQEGRNDYAPAETFGVVHFITTGDLRSMQQSQQNKDLSRDIRKFAANYIRGVDYIIPAGNPMVVALIAMTLGSGDHKFLKWDGRKTAYIPFTLNQSMALLK